MKKLGLFIAGLLILIGVLKPDLSWITIPNNNSVVTEITVEAPTDPVVLEKSQIVLQAAKTMSRIDSIRLRDLYLDIATLVELDGEDLVIKNTEEIRQANSLSGVMLKLDIKGKYANLPAITKDVVVSAIGDDNVNLDADLRSKAAGGFRALAWAFNGGK